MLSWIQKQRIRWFLRFSMWVVPLSCTALTIVAATAIRWIDSETQLTLLKFEVGGAQALSASFVATSISYMVFLAPIQRPGGKR